MIHVYHPWEQVLLDQWVHNIGGAATVDFQIELNWSVETQPFSGNAKAFPFPINTVQLVGRFSNMPSTYDLDLLYVCLNQMTVASPLMRSFYNVTAQTTQHKFFQINTLNMNSLILRIHNNDPVIDLNSEWQAYGFPNIMDVKIITF